MQQEEIFNLFRKILKKKKSFYYDRSYLNIPWILVTASAEIKKTYILKAGNKAIISIDGKPSFKGHWSFSNNKQSLVLNFEGEDATIYDLGFYNDTFMLLRQENEPYQLFFSEEKLNEIPKGSDPILYKRLNAVKVLATRANALSYLDYIVNHTRKKWNLDRTVIVFLILSVLTPIIGINLLGVESGDSYGSSEAYVGIMLIMVATPGFVILFITSLLETKQKTNATSRNI